MLFSSTVTVFYVSTNFIFLTFIYYIIVTSFFPVQNSSNFSNVGSRKCEEGA